MESGFWARVMAAVHEERGRLASRPYEYKGIHLLSSLWSDYRGAGAPVGSVNRMIMKIIIFSIKSDKFTMFFDKFPKNIIPATDCNQKGCHINLSVSHAYPAAKKFFRPPRICPQLPAFPLYPK